MRRRVPNTDKLSALIGWQPRADLNDILTQVIEEARTKLVPTAEKAIDLRDGVHVPTAAV